MQKAAPRKKVVAKLTKAAKRTGVLKKIALPKKAVPVSKKALKGTVKKPGKGVNAVKPDFCKLPVKGAKGGKATKGARLVKRSECVRASLFSLVISCTPTHLRSHR